VEGGGAMMMMMMNCISEFKNLGYLTSDHMNVEVAGAQR
jgi:hypothetical protein